MKGSDVPLLMGEKIVKAEHLRGDSDAHEQVIITTDRGTVLTVGTSEWLHVTVSRNEGDARKMSA